MSEQEFRVELVTRRADVPLDAKQWNALVAVNETNTVFQTYEWFDAWWQNFGAGRQLYFLIVRAGDTISGFAPLTLRRSPFGWRLLEFAGTGNADYQDFILPTDKPRQLQAICHFLRARRWQWERLALANVPSHSSTHAALSAAGESSGLQVVDEIRVSCPTLMLAHNSVDVRHMIDKYSLRRPLNWFSKRGVVGFRHVTSADEISALLPAFFDQHRRRWRTVGKYSLFSETRQMRFYETLAGALHARGWLQFSVVEFNGEPIAFHFGFDYGGCLTWYKPSFETRYAEHSPGLLLTRQLIEDGLKRSRRELDFTVGDEAFKGRFSSHYRYNLNFGVYPGGVTRAIAVFVRDLRRFVSGCMRRLRGAAKSRADLTDSRLPAPDRGSA